MWILYANFCQLENNKVSHHWKYLSKMPEETILNFVGINSSIKIIHKVNTQQENMPDDLLNNINSDKNNKFVIHS